jgi:hypothetical protein
VAEAEARLRAALAFLGEAVEEAWDKALDRWRARCRRAPELAGKALLGLEVDATQL